MSILSFSAWVEKFYPVGAWTFKSPAESGHPLTKEYTLAAIDHSIKKWSGLGELTNYGCTYSKHWLYENQNGMLRFDSTCALCMVFYDENVDVGYGSIDDEDAPCATCPIFMVEGKSCTETWHASSNNGDPMVELLKMTRDEIEANWDKYYKE